MMHEYKRALIDNILSMIESLGIDGYTNIRDYRQFYWFVNGPEICFSDDKDRLNVREGDYWCYERSNDITFDFDDFVGYVGNDNSGNGDELLIFSKEMMLDEDRS